VILDGALGTELERRGFPTTLPLWSAKALLEAPNLVWEIHKDYVAAGADVLSACTFRTTPYTLAKVGLQHRAEELTHQAIRYARAATAESSNIKHQTSNPILVAGSIAPMEDCYNPELAPASGILRTEHARFAKMLVDAGADLLLVETQNSAREAIIAAQAALATSLPVWVSLMPKSATEIFNGDPLAETAQRIHNLGAEVVLLNCARPAIIAGAFGVLATTLPGAAIGLYPNLISPSSASAGEGRDAGSFAAWLSRFAPPASVLGGCCGTTPEHIAELVKLLTRRGGSMGAGNP
jgi:S-methylmethionine-dependent homocysteine/selenocysteine methylase